MNWVVDVVLALALVGSLIRGIRRGFARVVFGVAGAVAGGFAAYYAVPLVGGVVPDATWRLLASIAVALALVIAGHAIGASIGAAIARRFTAAPLRAIDRVLGAAVSVAAALIVILLVAASVTPLGIPPLTQAVRSSVVISTIREVTPQPVQSLLAQVRSTAVTDTIPNVVEAFGGVTTAPELPSVDTASGALQRTAASVLRISGNAFSCGQSQSGTGFVVATNRVLTNAHVVSGVTEPVVETASGTALPGRVVYFNPLKDLAVIAVDALETRPVTFSASLAQGDDAVFNGYPFGGPFTSGPARVLNVGQENVDDIYGESANPREVYTLAADVQQGDSGGPLLATDGTVVGVVFAKSATTANLGYAMTMAEVQPVVETAASLTAMVDTASCING